MVLCVGDCYVWGGWFETSSPMETGRERIINREKVTEKGKDMSDFAKGLVIGVVATATLFGVILALQFFHNRDKELIEYAERQIEIEALREDYSNRDPVEFLEVPGVGDALRDAQSEFDRKRDEALYRFRSGLAD